MNTRNDAIKAAILEAALPDIPFDGWSMAVLERAAEKSGHKKAMAASVFPAGAHDAAAYFSRWADEKTITALSAQAQPARVRDKITQGVRTRLEILTPHKEAERLAIALWMRPFRKAQGAKLVWKTADAIWNWAGDTATDYNRYTKRGLLSGVLTATTLFWLTDTSRGHADSWAFLDRRIEDVMRIGKIVGRRKTA